MSKSILTLFIFSVLLFNSCKPSKQEKAAQLYQTQCGSCHMVPEINDLPKHLWKDAVLPEMAARMGIKDSVYNPYRGNSFPEQEAMMKSGIYTVRPSISQDDWKLLKDYIVAMAPENLPDAPPMKMFKDESQFSTRTVDIDSSKGTSITFLDIDKENHTVNIADIDGNLVEYNAITNKVAYQDNFQAAVTSYSKKDTTQFITQVGILNPSEITAGRVYRADGTRLQEIISNIHRPVHTAVADLNENGFEELVVSEFGHLTGGLSIWHTKDNSMYKEKVLLGQPGIVRTIVKDMNADGKKDIALLSSQGNEGISILYQSNDLQFNVDQVIRFSPIYGSSWFELVDYNSDGFDDIITVNGDNADKTYVHKPYHGMRIFINDGNNNFNETYFYPLNGATRLVARDFDQDGDVDFGLLSSFPVYAKKPKTSFVYLENKNTSAYDFKSFSYDDASLGRWLLLDAEDIDNDGDDDIVLSSFTYSFTPVPEDLSKQWNESNVDLLILENNLVRSRK